MNVVDPETVGRGSMGGRISDAIIGDHSGGYPSTRAANALDRCIEKKMRWRRA